MNTHSTPPTHLITYQHLFIRIIFLGLMCVCSLLSLAGCSSDDVKDGPPTRHVDLRRVHRAIPTNLPKSKSGNSLQYRIANKTYRVMPSAYHYEQRGVASWYGTKFHGQLTASGEPYSMYAMTAASPTLPIPCFIRVTNLKNHRSVIVKVNDRGPFLHHRILDLSYVAAKELGYADHGTAPIELKTIDPTCRYPHFPKTILAAKKTHPSSSLSHAAHASRIQTSTPTTSTTALSSRSATASSNLSAIGSSKLYLQIAAFQKRERAEQYRSTLTQQSPPLPIRLLHFDQDGHSIYRLRIGPIINLNQQNATEQWLRQAGITHYMRVHV